MHVTRLREASLRSSLQRDARRKGLMHEVRSEMGFHRVHLQSASIYLSSSREGRIALTEIKVDRTLQYTQILTERSASK